MRSTQPKKTYTNISPRHKETNGNIIRRGYAEHILEDAPILPKPLEYADIDAAFEEFVKTELALEANGEEVPTYTLYSNQRFSEYSQTWQHTDEEGNLRLNFKTINRATDANSGDNQGKLWNIPGERRYTMLTRSVLEDNGTESYEVYSMKQPYAVNLDFRVSFVTDLFENLNVFNERINDLFKSRQFYIRPNGHYVPLILENVADESKYSVGDYRFFVQTVVIKCYAYIIHEDDFRVDKFPKRVNLVVEGERKKSVHVDIEESENPELTNQELTLSVGFEPWVSKAEFNIDTDFDIQTVDKTNIRNLRIWVNDTPIYWNKGFKVKDGDNIRIKIFQVDEGAESKVVFKGTNPNVGYEKYDIPQAQTIEVE